MIQIPDEVWLKLGSEQRRDTSLVARIALPAIDSRVLGAIDSEGRRHVLIALKHDDEGLDDSQSRGISVRTGLLSRQNQDEERFIDLLCLDHSGHSALDIIGGEIAERLSRGIESPNQCVSRVLSKWRRFWGNVPKNLLPEEKQIGLVAELWFLLFWLIPRIGPESALTWRGPSGSRHDFESTHHSVEVKATTSTRGPIHRITSLSQLSPPENGQLMLFSLQLRREGGATVTLPTLIAHIQGLLKSTTRLLDHFEEMLQRIGYSPFHEADYEHVRWRIQEQKLFIVNQDFPRITIESFGAGIPGGVESVSYEINLSACEHLCIAKAPSDSFPY